MAEAVGGQKGLVHHCRQATDQPAFEEVILEQGNVAFQAGHRPGGGQQSGDGPEPPDGSQGAILVLLGVVLGQTPAQFAQLLAVDAVELAGLQQDLGLTDLVDHALKARSGQEFRHRLGIDPVALVVEFQTGQVDDAMIAHKEEQRMLNAVRPHGLHGQGRPSIQQHGEDRPLQVAVVRRFAGRHRRQFGARGAAAGLGGAVIHAPSLGTACTATKERGY